MAKAASIQGNLEINKKEGYVLLSVNPKIYPLDVVLSAAYVFLERCYVLVDGDPNEEIVVELRPKDKKQDIETLGRDFNNELVSYASYAVQSLKNEPLREAIINRVLLTNSQEEEWDEEEHWNDEPENISKPWEESEDIAKPWEEKYDDSSTEEASYLDDPEGIAIPWEEKYGKDKDKPAKK